MKIKRCSWVSESEIYKNYHDNDWGNPIFDDNKLFEYLSLEIFQAGLSWLTILKKKKKFLMHLTILIFKKFLVIQKEKSIFY